MKRFAALALVACTIRTGTAQAPPAFEAASVKVNKSGVSFRIVGGPKWIDEDRFDVVASVTGPWTFQQMHEMVRTLLAAVRGVGDVHEKGGPERAAPQSVRRA